jgi:hypothetical protein
MNKIITGLILTVALVLAVVSTTTGTGAYYSDSETAAGNLVQGWTPTLLTQTSQVDFNSGVMDSVDISSTPGSVRLSLVSGAVIVASDDTESHTDSSTYQLIKTLNFTKSGSANRNLRFETNLKSGKQNNALSSIRINLDGVNIFTHSTESTSYVSFSDQIDVSTYTDGNHLVELYLKIDKNNVTAYNAIFEIYDANSSYSASGSLASQVFNTGNTATKWNALFWDVAAPANTGLAFAVRASDSSFSKDDTALTWTTLAGNSPLLSGLPTGRYKQWRATLITGNNQVTPVLSEVRLYYYP